MTSAWAKSGAAILFLAACGRGAGGLEPTLDCDAGRCVATAACDGGSCAPACTPGGKCALADPCSVGVVDCLGGSPTCVHAGSARDGTPCGSGDTCLAGACGSCAGAGETCTLAGAPCATGTRFCNGNGSSVCAATGNVPDGTTCNGNQTCVRGICVACVAGSACVDVADPCHAGVMTCTGGVSSCVGGADPAPNGKSCGTGRVCNAGSCVACAAGSTCDAGSPCQAGFVSCASGSPSCVAVGPLAADGTSCGADAVCVGGVCTTCVPGAPCTLVGGTGCIQGTTVCTNGPRCAPGAPVADGAMCAYAAVCVGGACVPQLSLSAGAGPFEANLTWNGPLATLSDALVADTAADLSVTVDWGDQTTSAGTLDGANGSFAVSGAHTYAAGTLGLVTVSLTVTDVATGAAVRGTVAMDVGIAMRSVGSPVDSIAVDSAGSEWITVPQAHLVDDLGPPETPFALPSTAFPIGIAWAPDSSLGKLWIADSGRDLIAQIAAGGSGGSGGSGTSAVAEFPVTPGAQPAAIAVGPDGNLWFTEPGLGQIGMLTPDGTLSEFATGKPGSVPTAIAAGPDGNVWFTDAGTNSIGRVLAAGAVGQITEYPGALAVPQAITAGPGGDLWFGQAGGNLGIVSPAGLISTIAAGFGARAVFFGPDGNVWFATSAFDATVGRVTPSGSVTTFTVPFQVMSFARGPSGTILMATSEGVASFTP